MKTIHILNIIKVIDIPIRSEAKIIVLLIACSFAWYTMHKWLENFADKTELSWWIFALAGLITMLIALLTVSWQTLRAARRNPVEALRYE